LEDSKVVLRQKRLSDARNDFTWGTDEELSRLDAARPLALTFREAQILYEDELAYPQPRKQRFAIETRSGLHIGNCMLYDINKFKGQAELGIMIGDRRFWGKAYGTNAVRLLLEHIFTETKLNRIYLHTLDWNIRAQKSFEKSGFVSKGPVHRDGHNFLTMEITREGWQQVSPGAGREMAQAS
jgi:RimJ/RimL family protein N-acetyltransferase